MFTCGLLIESAARRGAYIMVAPIHLASSFKRTDGIVRQQSLNVPVVLIPATRSFA